jgi:phosphoribosylaminoimidazolecarboxamide formyltransferase / IMP cyclohydrolase
MSDIKIKSAFISVFSKEGLDIIVKKLASQDVKIVSTGGTYDFIKGLGVEAKKAEDITTYPSILGGRVKTLHPGIFGGILARRSEEGDMKQVEQYNITLFDLVVVDLYPFEETVASGALDEDIIEKIDIGGISLIRAGAKNFKDVLIISSRSQYDKLYEILEKNNGITSVTERLFYAGEAFNLTSNYDTAIFNWFNRDNHSEYFKKSIITAEHLRYGENPHQKGLFFGDLGLIFDQLHGKEISYNNLLDIDSALGLIDEFDEVTVAILKHNNACGVASRQTIRDAWIDALACDPVSAYGGVAVVNRPIDADAATEMDKVFLELVIAPAISEEALEILKHKKNRIILLRKDVSRAKESFRSMLGGVLWQEKDLANETIEDMKSVTKTAPSAEQLLDMVFANRIVKHSRSNAIVLAKNKQLCASGIGQTSRIDALKQAIDKAGTFGFSLKGAVMASDAYFPFADSVETAAIAGITAIVQPGGSVRDTDSVDYCNNNGIAMAFTGIRHFKH